MAVTTSPKQFCRFSINGVVADKSAPNSMLEAMKEVARPNGVITIADKNPAHFVTGVLPNLLFAADEHVDIKLLTLTTDALRKYERQFVNCVADFVRKKNHEFNVKYIDLQIRCTVSGEANIFKTELTELNSPIVRAAYLSR